MSPEHAHCQHKVRYSSTMEPLSPNIRRLYLYFSVVLFMLLLPAVIFYADGWRFKRGFGFVRTGGIFVSVPYTGATVSINNEQVGESGFLERSFYVDNLAPSVYTLRVEREGNRTWERLLVVEPQLVTDARALLIPTEIDLIPVATTSPEIENENEPVQEVSLELYQEYLAVFTATSTATTTASTTIPIDESDGIGLFLREGNLFAGWLDKGALPPSIFCGRPSYCNPEITIERSEGEVNRAFFYNRGVVFSTKEGGIYFVEADIRPTALSVQLYSAKGAQVRLVGDTLLIRDGQTTYEVAGL